jgi:hypothetical protein
MGRVANGAASDRGVRVHAVPDGCQQYEHAMQAACGVAPGSSSGGWDVIWFAGRAYTCPRCLAALRRAERNAAATR